MACERSWYYRYVLGLQDPVGKAAELGTQGHERIAHYINTWEDILGDIEGAGREYIDRWITTHPNAHRVEQRVDGGLTLGTIPVIGGMDLYVESPGIPARVSVTDWKFKGDITMGKTTPEWLRSITHPDGIQMIGYAEWVRRNKDALGLGGWHDRVLLRHVHFQTKGPRKASQTEVEVPLAEVKEKWDTLSEQYENRIRRVAAESDPKAVTPNLGHCFKYHKACAFHAQCQGNAQPQRTFAFGRPKESTVSMLSQLKSFSLPDDASVEAIQAGAQALRSAKPSLIIDESTVPDAVLKAQRDEIAGEKPAPQVQEDATAPTISAAAGQVERPTSVHPVAVDSAAVLSQTAKPKKGRPLGSKNKKKPGVMDDLPAARAAAEAKAIKTGAIEDLEEVARIDGLLLEIQNAPQLEAAKLKQAELGFVPVSQELLDAAARKKEADAKAAQAAVVAASEVRLYLTGTPIGVLVQDFGVYVDQVHKALLEDCGRGAIDIRLSEAGGFGKWKPILAAWAKLAETPLPAPGYYVVPQDELAETVANALIGRLAPGAVTR